MASIRTYGLNNPVMFVDPTGLEVTIPEEYSDIEVIDVPGTRPVRPERLDSFDIGLERQRFDSWSSGDRWRSAAREAVRYPTIPPGRLGYAMAGFTGLASVGIAGREVGEELAVQGTGGRCGTLATRLIRSRRTHRTSGLLA